MNCIDCSYNLLKDSHSICTYEEGECVKISVLEKENAELKTKKIPQLERKIASIRGAHSVDCKKLNARTEQVERLKKENAELKDKNKALEQYADLADGKVDEVKEQLTRAKELLEDLIMFQPYIDKETIFISIGNGWKTAIYKAEQFLKGE